MDKFKRLETLKAFITFGCPISIFHLCQEKSVADQLPEGAIWENYYDPADVLGYPLWAINPAFADTLSRDVPIVVGGPLTKWNPLSHNEYWTDADQTEPIAHHIQFIVNASGA